MWGTDLGSTLIRTCMGLRRMTATVLKTKPNQTQSLEKLLEGQRGAAR